MDYKNLIELLRFTVEHGDEEPREYCANMCARCELIDQAADAIETLLAERDALMQDVIRCDTCIHVKECYFNELRRNDCAQSNRGHWKWRGQKGENHD